VPNPESTHHASSGNASNWKTALLHGTTFLVGALGVALYHINTTRLPKGSVDKKVVPPIANNDVPRILPEEKTHDGSKSSEELSEQMSEETRDEMSEEMSEGMSEEVDEEIRNERSESVPQSITGGLSRYISKSRTVVSTSDASYYEASSSVTSLQVLESGSENSSSKQLDM
jgi:hypothetical protein